MTALLAERAWPSVSGAPLVLVPLGSTEQHGPHLPFSTDSVVATAVATGLADRLDNAIVAPTIYYGASGEHQSFPGTVSVGHEALQLMLVELARSLSTWAGSILIVNGHGGNVASLSVVIPQLIAEQHRVAWVPCTVRHGDAHAGRIETSLMLHLAPQSVDMASASPGNVSPMSELLPAMRKGGTRAVSASGVLGDPIGATASDGVALLDKMIATALRRFTAYAVDDRGCLA
ncbi:mycofactocin biosynthesis peptidyl-dipeptidase MftE [Glaciihabitans sp. UYNi722]|uniref:mycofactocin biosynthesis peptidyl-dipeptidase MftE n=1 Tax=Glaciihabitans sp. UYNi722 TaxID=3156344 RepID=UPI00339130FD